MRSTLQTFAIATVFLASFSAGIAQTERYPFQTGDGNLLSAISWSPKDDLILTSSGYESGLRLWDVSSGKLLWKTDVGFLQDDLELHSIRHCAWTTDQRQIATGTDNGKLQLWDAANGKPIWNIRAHAGQVTAIAISPDSTMLISSADVGNLNSELKVWSLRDGKLIRDLSANQKDISAIRFVDQNRFQTGNGFGWITTWSTNESNVISTKQVTLCGGLGRVRTVYSADLTLLAAQCRTKLVLKEVLTNQTIKSIARDDSSGPVSFSPDNRVLMMPGSQMLYIRTATTRELRGFNEGVLNHDSSLIAAPLSYRGDGVQIFDTRRLEKRRWLVGHPGVIKSLAFSADGELFFSGSADRIVRVWDTQSRQARFSLAGHTGAVESLEVSADGRTLISHSRNETIVWDIERGVKLRETREEQHFDDQRKKALSPSGKLALVAEYEKPFRLVDALTDRTIKDFISIDQLDSLVFCPDEKHFLVKPWWGGWQLWSLDADKPIREFDIGYSSYNRVAFHPNGKTFITGGEGQNIFMFDLETGKRLWSLFEIDQQEYESKKAAELRRVTYIEKTKERARLADIENEPYASKVYISFDHYGDMTPMGEQRIAETDTPAKSKVQKSATDANAIWFRLHNDSPLPVSVPTQSMYLRNPKCFREFAGGQKVFGLCDGSEISVWLGLEDKEGKALPFGFDFGSSAILLPGKSVLFAAPIYVLRDGQAIVFGVKFQKPIEGKGVGDFGNEHVLKFRESDLPKRRAQ